jgi:hypothetical protein
MPINELKPPYQSKNNGIRAAGKTEECGGPSALTPRPANADLHGEFMKTGRHPAPAMVLPTFDLQPRLQPGMPAQSAFAGDEEQPAGEEEFWES